MKRKLELIIDGNAMLNVFYYGSLPDNLRGNDDPKWYSTIQHNKYGVYTNAMRGFMSCFTQLLNTLHPDYVAVAFDIGTETFRKKLCKSYKQTRNPEPFPLREQIDVLRESLRKMGVPVYVSDLFEADDIIATIADHESRDKSVICCTTDHDYLQMITDNVQVALYVPNKNKFDDLHKKYGDRVPIEKFKFILFNAAMVKEEYGISPFQIPDYKGLAGDTSDNIPGVAGIADKSAVALLSLYPTIDKIFEDVKNVPEEELKELWKASGMSKAWAVYNKLTESGAENKAKGSKILATTYRSVPLGNLGESLKVNINRERYIDFVVNFLR